MTFNSYVVLWAKVRMGKHADKYWNSPYTRSSLLAEPSFTGHHSHLPSFCFQLNSWVQSGLIWSSLAQVNRYTCTLSPLMNILIVRSLPKTFWERRVGAGSPPFATCAMWQYMQLCVVGYLDSCSDGVLTILSTGIDCTGICNY